jgi:hypothetical protein
MIIEYKGDASSRVANTPASGSSAPVSPLSRGRY